MTVSILSRWPILWASHSWHKEKEYFAWVVYVHEGNAYPADCMDSLLQAVRSNRPDRDRKLIKEGLFREVCHRGRVAADDCLQELIAGVFAAVRWSEPRKCYHRPAENQI